MNQDRKAKKHEYYLKNKQHINARVRAYEQATGKSRQWRQALKEEIFSWYGRVCRCCGEKGLAFLSLDHIFDNGSQERRENQIPKNRGTGMHLYGQLRKAGFENRRLDLQVLCFNCQWGKRLHKGFCPHHPDIDLRIPCNLS